MGFVVLPALVADISAVYDVYFAAFKDNAVTRALFPNTSTNDMANAGSEFRKAHTAHVSQYWAKDSTQYTLKCVDCETGEIVGMALWDIYLTPSQWRRPELSWLEGGDRERAEALISPLWDAREKFWLDKRYLYCHVMAVHPSNQRKGIGEMLLNYGIGVAQQTELPIYIESSREGKRLYEKVGCQRLKRPAVSQKILTNGKINGKKDDNEAMLFVWFPKGKEDALAKGIELV
ncbi:hypothetical protein EK21DRAFT_118285 [Setomelanomma holmii]|uniref:N-acetyltransferase domain-containing protein n=1 Tax=Setomelanomma holmii TaxID=210430 RepID=A0A9P4GW02_9PLEO|nr:hypothetical protein EK21DRAFT_118285 [Setomelanomma holmii]